MTFCCLLRNKGYTDFSRKIIDQSIRNSLQKFLIDQNTELLKIRELLKMNLLGYIFHSVSQNANPDPAVRIFMS